MWRNRRRRESDQEWRPSRIAAPHPGYETHCPSSVPAAPSRAQAGPGTGPFFQKTFALQQEHCKNWTCPHFVGPLFTIQLFGGFDRGRQIFVGHSNHTPPFAQPVTYV